MWSLLQRCSNGFKPLQMRSLGQCLITKKELSWWQVRDSVGGTYWKSQKQTKITNHHLPVRSVSGGLFLQQVISHHMYDGYQLFKTLHPRATVLRKKFFNIMIKSRAGFSLVEKCSHMVSYTAHPWNTMWLERVLGYFRGWLVVLSLSSLSAKVMERRYLIWFWRRKRLFRLTYCKRKIFRWETCLWEGWKLWVGAKQKLDAWKCCVNQSERREREEGRKLRPESEEMCHRPWNREMW